MEEQLRGRDPEFLHQLFTPGEIAYCGSQRHPAQHYAARVAAKEAVFKALNLNGRDGASWREVEVRPEPGGGRRVVLHGRIKRLAERRGVRRVLVSLSHTRALAAASILLES